jgi:hypothetical protein
MLSHMGNVHIFFTRTYYMALRCTRMFSFELHRSREGTVLLGYSCFGILRKKSRFCLEQYTMLTTLPTTCVQFRNVQSSNYDNLVWAIAAVLPIIR